MLNNNPLIKIEWIKAHTSNQELKYRLNREADLLAKQLNSHIPSANPEKQLHYYQQ